MTPPATREASIPPPDVELDDRLIRSHSRTPKISSPTPDTDRSLGPSYHSTSSNDDFELVEEQPIVQTNDIDRPRGKGKKRNPSKPSRKQPQQCQQRKPRTQQPVPIQRKHQQMAADKDDQPSTSRQTNKNTLERGSDQLRSKRQAQSLPLPTISRRQGRPHVTDQPPLILIPNTEMLVTITDLMRPQNNIFIEKMQPILVACVGGAILVAPRNYIPMSGFRNKVKEKLRSELMGRELIVPSHSQVDLVIRHCSLAQILWKPLTFNTI